MDLNRVNALIDLAEKYKALGDYAFDISKSTLEIAKKFTQEAKEELENRENPSLIGPS